MANGGCNHRCTNFEGHFECSCRHGFVLAGNGKTCLDIDECSISIPCFHICYNTPGGFQCECQDGYTLGSDGMSCIGKFAFYLHVCMSNYIQIKAKTYVDDDECLTTDNGGCQQICINIAGTHECHCRDGFTLEGDLMSCRDINECSSVLCEHYCVNIPGSYQCECREGFNLDADRISCRGTKELL